MIRRFMVLTFRAVFLTIMALTASCEEVLNVVENQLGTGNIRGKVIDLETGKPIALATIESEPPTTMVSTDSTGHYRIFNISPGIYTLTADKESYIPHNIVVDIEQIRTINLIHSLAKK